MTKDLRRYARQTNIRLFVGFFVILFIVGETLIYSFYGQEAAIFGLLCLLAGSAPLILIWLILIGMERLVERANEEE